MRLRRPSRFLVGAFIDTPARIANTALDLAFAPAEVRRLVRENTALTYDRDRLAALADRLATANTDLSRANRALVTLDDEDDATEYEPAAQVFGPVRVIDDLAELAATETLSDILWSHGDGWSS